MIIHEPIYGDIAIDSPCMVELLVAPSVLRLRGIAQLGFPDALYFKDGFSRYEHCVGVMALLSRLGASEEEQIAGLLHDVSHTAFSHLIDWAIGDPLQENFQDKHHERFVRDSELPNILTRYGLDVARIVDHHLFSLLEQDAPALCADRIDYTLRELPRERAHALAHALVANHGRIVFAHQDAAQVFADAYMNLQETSWGGLETSSFSHPLGMTVGL